MKTIKLLKQHVLRDIEQVAATPEKPAHQIEHRVTNPPGAIISLPVQEADALIAAGDAEEHTPAESSTAQPEEAAASSGSGAFAAGASASESDDGNQF